MKVLYVGDVMGKAGRLTLKKILLKICLQNNVDIVIAQAENVSHGKGMNISHYSQLKECGVNGFTGGNHSFERQDTINLVINSNMPVVAPANVLGDTFNNYKIVTKNGFSVAIVSLLGYTIPGGYDDNTQNPLICMDNLLPIIKKEFSGPIIVNFHGDISSEKVMMGHFLDGKVAAVIGDHWHVPAADERILSNGTAYISDVGMCGVLDSSLGVDWNVAIERWKGSKVKHCMYDDPPYQFNGVLITLDSTNNRAKSISRIREIIT